jgi:iron complex outermembrane receptor protein
MIRKLLVLMLAGCSSQAIAQTPEADDNSSADIVVTGTAYRGEVASGGARIDAKIEDLPLSISVVTEAVVEDRQVRNIRELADNVAGVQSRSSGAQAFSTDFTIRGFQGFATGVSINGFRVDGYAAGRDPAVVDRVEFIKGPASVLYGASSALSGLANIVTKTPRSDNFLEVELTGGQFGYGRAAVDANVRLTDTLDGRLNTAVTIEDPLNAFTDLESQLVAPSLRWRPLPGVAILAEGIYFHGVQPTREAGLYRNYARYFTLPDRFKLGDYADRNTGDTYSGRIEATWDIAPNLTFRQGVNVQQYDEVNLAVAPTYGNNFITPNVVERAVSYGTGDNYDFSSQTELRWTVQTGPFRHKLLIGYERSYQDFAYSFTPEIPYAPLDLNNPVYGAPLPALPFDEPGATRTWTNAIYAQDFIELGDHWKLLAGLRYDMTKAQYFYCQTPGCLQSNDPAVNGASPAGKENAFSPRLGLVWQPTERTTVFASWSKSFAPQPYADRQGNLLPPERGTQYEIGVRQHLLSEGRLVLSLAAFDLTRQNVTETDPVDDNFSVAIGEQRAKGFEAELTGKLLPWIDLVATYAYVDAKVTNSNVAVTGIPIGTQLSEAPRHSASLFTKIAFEPLGLPDTAVSVGVYYLGRRPTRDYFSPPDPSVTFYSATTRIDLGIYQQISPKLRVQGNITNLTSERIYEPANQGYRRAQPFRATVGVRVTL